MKGVKNLQPATLFCQSLVTLREVFFSNNGLKDVLKIAFQNVICASLVAQIPLLLGSSCVQYLLQEGPFFHTFVVT